MSEAHREAAENKLILLYLIKKLGFSVTNPQITRIVLENQFMNYFFLQQYLNDLSENSLIISAIQDNKTYYSITQNGERTLNCLENLIPLNIKNKIDEVIYAIKKDIQTEVSVISDFIPERKNEFTVTCKINEDKAPLIELNILVGTKPDARLICENWKNYSQLIYSEIIDVLTKNRNTHGNTSNSDTNAG